MGANSGRLGESLRVDYAANGPRATLKKFSLPLHRRLGAGTRCSVINEEINDLLLSSAAFSPAARPAAPPFWLSRRFSCFARKMRRVIAV